MAVPILIFIFTIACVLADTEHILDISQEQVTEVGKNISISCTVKLPLDIPVFWYKIERLGSSIVYSTNGIKSLRHDRLTTYLTKNETAQMATSVIELRDITNSDAGIYECLMNYDRNKPEKKQVEILVKRQPEINEKLSTLHVTVREGERAKLMCEADGYPKPEIKWTRENEQLFSSGGSSLSGAVLEISRTDKTDRGIYYCTAVNVDGHRALRTAKLGVEFSPIIHTYKPKVAQANGYSIDLECDIEANPAPQVTWSKDGVELYNNGYYSITHLGTSNDRTHSVLKVIAVDEKAYGQYKCSVMNQHGTASKNVQLYKSQIPLPQM